MGYPRISGLFSAGLLFFGICAAPVVLPGVTCAAAPTAPLPAFPGASGFGSTTVGGSGRHLREPGTTVYRVTSLADSGPNTLRDCVTSAGPRVCIFETSGRIPLEERLEITEPYLTIAGQTAPSPGVMLTGAGLKISTHDVVVRHLMIRVGDAAKGPKPQTRDGVTFNGKSDPAFNIIVDHVSVTWALDENMNTYADVHDVTISNSILSEGLHHSIHPDGPHSMGILIGEGSQRISVHDCLFTHNNDRNPRQKGGSSLEFLNNVVYDWGGFSGAHEANPSDTDDTGKPTLLTFAGNVYLPGPNSPKKAPLFAKPISEGLRIFVEHNVGPTREKDEGDEWLISAIPETPYRVMTPPLALSGVPTRKPAETLQQVLSRAGARPNARDAVDVRLAEEVHAKTGTIPDCISGCWHSVGGWPEIEVRTRKLVVPSSPNKLQSPGGYTKLEEWLNCFAQMVEEGKPASCE